jgi:hypothetical protein
MARTDETPRDLLFGLPALHTGLIDQVSRTRFLLEAEIAGGLEHPGIVPVDGLGHYGDGRPCYAMRFKLWKKLAVLPDATHRMVQIPDKGPCVSPKLANWTPMRSISER